MSKKPERIFIIDGMGFAFRAFFAIRNLSNSKGEPTNAVFGFARIMMNLLRDHEATHFAMTFDAPGKTFRDDLYPEYKGNRPDTPEDLRFQIPIMHRLTEALNMTKLCVEGVEADDVIGTLARQAEEAGMEAVIVSGDKDVLQLVTDKVSVFDPSKGDNGVWYDVAGVRERYGVGPEHVIDVLALMGDSADNVPGVRGIGEKTARTLLEQFGDLDGLYANLDKLKGKQKEKVETDKANAYLSKELVTIKTDVPLSVTLEDCRKRAFDRDALFALFNEMEFHTLSAAFAPEPEAEKLNYELVLTETQLEAVIAEMRGAGRFAVDTETTGTDPMRAVLVGISLSAAPATGYYIPVRHQPEAMVRIIGEMQEEALEGMAAKVILEKLKPLLEDASLGKIGHNIKYDMLVFRREGINLVGIAMDTMVASYLTDPSRMRHNLNEVSLQYLKRKPIPISQLIGSGTKSITFDYVPVDTACEYACEDADFALRLADVFQPLLEERDLTALHTEVELPLIAVLADIEQRGVTIDLALFEELRQEIQNRLTALESQIFEEVGEPFQINSPKQLQTILFDKLGLPPQKKTKTGYSTDVEVLEQLADEHAVPRLILEFRMLEKLRSTYVEALPKLMHPETGRIHTSYNQAVAATGRLSSSDPNLQNIPVRTELGKRIREGFVAGTPDSVLISADYSQIELRVMAHLSGDDALRQAFLNGADIHAETAARVFGVFLETVTPDMRRQAKAVNFGVIYGISAFGLARNLGLGNKQAQEFIDHYFQQYPGVMAWLEATKEQARSAGYVTTMLNRRRYIPGITSSDMTTRRAAERVAINTPVQGTAADVIKVAMIRIHDMLRGSSAQMILQVHDELVLEAPLADAEEVARKVREVMESALEMSVPLQVDVGIGPNWSAIH